MIGWIDKDKVLFIIGCTFFILCCLIGFFFDNLVFIGIPIAVLLGVLIFKNIRVGLFLLCATVPCSFMLGELGALSFDFPDELLMIGLTGLMPFVLILNHKQVDWRLWFKNPIVILTILVFCWMCVSVIYSQNVALSLKYLLKRIWYILPFFVLPSLLFQNEKMIIRSYQGFFVSLIAVVCIAIYKHSLVGFSFDQVHDPVQPFFLNHVTYGSTVSCFIPLCIGGIFLSRKLSVQWIVSLAALAVLLLAVYFAYSRAAWMAVIFAAGVFIAVRLKLVRLMLITFYVLVFSLVMWLSTNNKYLEFKPKFEKTIMHTSLEDHIVATLRGTDISSAERYYRWIAAIRMSRDYPWTGAGPNNFYDYYKAYTITAFKTWVSRNPERSTTHNYFLFMLVEQGFIAMVLYGVWILVIFGYGQHVYHRVKSNRFYGIALLSVLSMLGAFFINNFFSELIETDKIGGLFLLGLAIIVAIDYKYRKSVSQEAQELVAFP